MREIKFRYRLLNTSPVELSGVEPNGVMYKYLTLEELEGTDFTSMLLSYPILSRDLYTNSNDKNGKEIYEGDILQEWNKGGWVFKSLELQKEYEVFMKTEPKDAKDRYDNWLPEYQKMGSKTQRYDINKMEKGGIFTVFWDYCGFIPFYGSEEEIILEPELTEVIGNIYENQELLKT